MLWVGLIWLQHPIDLRGNSEVHDILPHALYQLTNTKLSPEDIKTSGWDSFESTLLDTLNFGNTQKVCWVYFELSSKQAQTAILSLPFPRIQSVALYDWQSLDLLSQAGTEVPMNSVDLPHRYPAIPVNLNSNQVHTYLLRVASKTSPLQIPLQVSHAQAFSQTQSQSNLILGLFYGLLLLMIGLNLYLWITFRQKAMFWHLFFIVFLIVTGLDADGFAGQFIWPDWVWMRQRGVPIMVGLMMILALHFSQSFLNTELSQPTFHFSLNGFKGAWLIIIYSDVFRETLLFFPGMLLTSLLLLLAGIWQYQNSISARLFVWAWCTFLLGLIVIVLERTGFLSPTFWTAQAWKMGSIAEASLLSTALLQRLREFQSEQKSLRQRQHDLHIHKNEQLESMVKERTIALQTSMVSLQQEQEKALQASQAKSQFLSTMTHELRTPMNAILGLAEVLAQTDLSNSQFEDLKTLKKSGQRLLFLMNDILDYAKWQAGRMTLDVSEINLDLFHKELQFWAERQSKKSVQIQWDFSGPHAVVGDEHKLNIIAQKVIKNAIQHTPNGMIMVNLSSDQKAIRLVVKDSGKGMDDQQLDTLFNPFQQADGSHSRKKQGAGLGMALVKAMVDICAGQIQVNSKPNQGTTVDISLPIQEKPIKKAEMPLQKLRKTAKVWVVDDNPINRKVIQKLLKGMGIESVMWDCGEKVINHIQKNHVDLILMDLEMPGLNGFQTTRKIRALYIHQPLIIALSASDWREQRARCLEAGMNGFLEKPIQRKQIENLFESP